MAFSEAPMHPAIAPVSAEVPTFARKQTSPAILSKPTLRQCFRLTLLFLFLAGVAKADSVVVTYTAMHETGHIWQYEYNVAGTLSSGDDLAIYFPLATSSALSDLSTSMSDLTSFVFQPDSGLPADGEFDIVATTMNPDLTQPFAVSFLYSGDTSPGSQAFTLYDSESHVLQTSSTMLAGVSPIPEPGTFALFGSGLTVLATVCRRRPPLR